MDTDFKKTFRYPFNVFTLYIGIIWIFFLGFLLCVDLHNLLNIAISIIILVGCVIMTFVSLNTLNKYLLKVKQLKTLIKDISEKEGYDNITLNTTNYKIEEIYSNILALYKERMKAINSANDAHKEAIEIEKSKLRSKRIMTNNINHEIKTPIGILQGYIETLMRHPDIAPPLREKFLSKCFDNIRRIDNIMSNISIITRLEDGSEAIKLDRILLNEIIANVQEEMSLFFAKENVKFNNNIPENIYIQTNESFFYALMNNLIKNALNYAKCSEITFSIIAEDNKFYTFEFHDDGIGVDEEHIEHIFDRFYRIDKNNTNKVTGSGLGLPIVQSIVHLHGGAISAKNNQSGGLSFIFTIPKD